MDIAIAICAMAGFGIAFHLLGTVTSLSALGRIAREAQRILFDPTLSDDDKEPLVRRASADMFGAIGAVLVRLGMCLGVPVALIWAGNLFGLAPATASIGWLLSWQLLGAALVAFGVIWWLRR